MACGQTKEHRCAQPGLCTISKQGHSASCLELPKECLLLLQPLQSSISAFFVKLLQHRTLPGVLAASLRFGSNACITPS